MKKIILLLLSTIIITGLCGCDSKKSEENYFGGKGVITQTGSILQDDTYFYFGRETLKKFNKETKTLSIACQTPGCDHSRGNPTCKANTYYSGYSIFNGNLIKKVDEIISNPDGTTSTQGYLYLCEENKQVFKNVFPDSFTDDQKKSGSCSIGVLQALGNDYLAVICSGFTYILDADFNIKFTILDMGLYSGGIYFYDNEIYYINNLYRLMKLNKETGEASAVDLGSMKITEGVLYGSTLWFSNEEQSICSYDFKTGEIKERVKNAVRFTLAGNYIEYLKPSYSENVPSEIRLLDLETGEDNKWELDGSYINLFSVDGNYYSYRYETEDELTQYSTDLSEVSDVYTLAD